MRKAISGRRSCAPIRQFSLIVLGGFSAIGFGVGLGVAVTALNRLAHSPSSNPPVRIAVNEPRPAAQAAPIRQPYATSIQPAIKPIRHGYPEYFVRFKPRLSTEEITRELVDVPEIVLEPKPNGQAEAMLEFAQKHHGNWSNPAPHPPGLSRGDFAGLPFRMGSDCYLGDSAAVSLDALSKRLHEYLDQAKQSGPKPPKKMRLPGNPLDDEYLAARLAIDSQALWQTPDAVPALVQILQAEAAPYRRLLVRLLSRIPGEKATAAIACRAVFDSSNLVREDAVYALRSRPEAQYRQILFEALHYPWPTAAEFAAEALVNLNRTSTIPQLIEMLQQPDPSEPFQIKTGDGDKWAIREVVQLNHLKNCLLCHAASTDQSDRVRGLVFDPDRKPTPASAVTTSTYYQGDSGYFARAEVTYLKQDFSLQQPVNKPGDLKKYERFDYTVRTRILDADEVNMIRVPRTDFPQRRAILFALRELTGDELGPNPAAWEKWLKQYPTAAFRSGNVNLRGDYFGYR